MRLLFDQNLSHRLAAKLADLFPESQHVREVGLAEVDDDVVWRYAKDNGLTIVSKDAEFHQHSFVFGHPPKVVWIRRGNCSTQDIHDILRSRGAEILAFGTDEASFLALD